MEKYIPASKFKAECLKRIDKVKASKKELIITKHGMPIVKLCPIEKKKNVLFGKMRGIMRIQGDIIEPIGEEWKIGGLA